MLVFKVLNPHLNIPKQSWHFHLEPRPTSPIGEENLDVVHLDEGVLEPNSPVQETPASPVSAEFVPFSRPHTRRQKAKSIQRRLRPNTQTVVQLVEQTDHLNDEAEVEEINPNSSLLAVASVSAELLKDTDQMDIPASEDPLSTVDLDPPSTEISPPWDFN